MSYQTGLDKARAFDQVSTAMRHGHVETPSSEPSQDPKYLVFLRTKVAMAVYAIWNETRKPASLGAIFLRVRDSVAKDPSWPREWTWPSKRTVDRRVNEAADIRFYTTQTPIVAVRAGFYIPNPRNFEGLGRTLLEILLRVD